MKNETFEQYLEKVRSMKGIDGFENLTVVRSEEELDAIGKPNHNYIMAHGIDDFVTPIPLNRGGVKDKKRSDFFNDVIRRKKFLFDMANIQITTDKVCADGNHKRDECIFFNIPYVFKYITPKSIEDVADLNSSPNPSWTLSRIFRTSLLKGSLMSINLYNLRREHLCIKYGIRESALNPSEMYTMVVQDAKYLKKGYKTMSLRLFSDETLIPRINSDEFIELFSKYCDLKYHIKDVERGYKIANAVLNQYFDENQTFDFLIFMDALNKYGIPSELRKDVNAKTILNFLYEYFDKGLRMKKKTHIL